jgi:hypothetical protein
VARQRRADSVVAIERRIQEARRLAAQRLGRGAGRGTGPSSAPPDTTPPPKMKRPAVSKEVYLTLAEPLKPGTAYRLEVAGIRSMSGTVKSPSRQFMTPRPEKKDSTALTRRPP